MPATEAASHQIEYLPLGALTPYERNSRTHSADQVAQLVASIQEFGFTNPVLIDDAGGLIAGHGRVTAASQLGMDTVPCIRLSHLSDAQKRAYVIADNQLALNAGWDTEQLQKELSDLQVDEFDLGLTGFDPDELASLLATEVQTETSEETIPPPPAEPVTKPGDLWLLGDHRLLCGDSTSTASIARLMDGHSVDAVVTDPPYCSGGFQEAGKAAGSIGTKRVGDDGKEYQPRIHNDALSSRGYCALMKAVLSEWKPSFAYMFTDWRMWVQLFDVMESSGFGVRGMIVWDKQTPGMGRGWRSQHELIMFGAAAKPEFDNHKAVGNVVTAKRTGNPDHPTQKPVEVLAKILEVTDFCANIGDPFLGSGTTLIAAEQLNCRCFGMEVSPAFCDVAVARWESLTGGTAERET